MRDAAFERVLLAKAAAAPVDAETPSAPAAPAATDGAKAPGPRSPFFSPAGKKLLAKQLVALIPQHHTFAEPFCGSAAVFFAKARCPREVLNDLNPKVSQAFADLKALTTSEIANLVGRTWIGSRALYVKLLHSEPQGRVDRLYNYMYVSIFSYGHKWGAGFNPGAEGQRTGLAKRLGPANDRMRGVIVQNGSYVPIVRQFDGESSFFFLDPPYAGTNVNVGESKFDEVEFRKILDDLAGRFLLTYGTTGKLNVQGFHVRRITPPRSIRHMRGAAKHTTLPTLLVANYAMAAKSLAGVGEDAWEFEDVEHALHIAKRAVGALPAIEAEHLAARLSMGASAAIVTAAPRTDVGRDRLLITEPRDGAPAGLAIVRLGKAEPITSIDALDAATRAAIGTAGLREATLRELSGDGPLFYQPVALVQKLDAPCALTDRDRLIEVASDAVACAKCGRPADRALILDGGDTHVLTCAADERVLRGRALVGGNRVTQGRRIGKADPPVEKPDRTMKLLKRAPATAPDAEQRFVLGILLEPEVRDSQGDIYSADEIRETAHDFMINSRRVGLMHQRLLGQGANVVESYLAPVDFDVNGEKVRKGTWLLGIHVVDDAVWQDVKAGKLTGLSIGGSSLRVSEN